MSGNVKLLENLLNYCTEKNKVIAKNLSNIGTERYQREDIVFKDILDQNVGSLLKTENSKHIANLNANPSTDENFEHTYDDSSEMASGVNNVNIEKEMSDLAENTLRFKFASRKIGDYYKNIQNVIKGGSV
jgi:flagellar basal-body rod protein FlgB